MALAHSSDLGSRLAEVQRLRGRIDSLQRRRADTDAIPVADELSALFPEGGLNVGASYALGASTSLLLALLATPSARGSWCAVIGMPEIGAEAAAAYGVHLDRLILIPDAGTRWMTVAATLAEAVPIIAVRPDARASAGEAARLDARLRDRGSVLLVMGSWAGADLRIEVSDARWQGIGEGHGLLRSRAVSLTAQGSRAPRPRRTRVVLPTASGRLGQSAPSRIGAGGRATAAPIAADALTTDALAVDAPRLVAL